MKTTNSTELPPIPPELMEYIEQAETETLPNPLDDPSVKTVWLPSARLSFINPVEQNGGKFSAFDAFFLPNGGTSLHLHNLEAEWFYVVEGNPDLQFDDELIQGSPETLRFSPIGQLHSIKNNTSEPVRLLLFYQPDPDNPNAIGNIERFFGDPRVSQSFDINNPDVQPSSFDFDELLAAAFDYGLFNPSTFVFPKQQYIGNEVPIVRTGVNNETASVTLEVTDGVDIQIDFGKGEFNKTIFLPSSLSFGEKTLDLVLKDPSEGSEIGLTSQQTELSELDGSDGVVITDINDDDVLTGGNGDDFLSGLGGNDIIQGLSGRDLILGGSGDDLITGGEDSDTVSGQDGDDNISGNNGDDSLNGNTGSDDILGGNGNDTINGGSESDRLLGEAGDDSIMGGAAGDRILGGNGNDILAGNGGDDLIFGDSGNDALEGNDGNDSLGGGAGNDTLIGGSGDDNLNGDSNKDLLIGIDPSDFSSNFGTGELDTLTGGANNDTFVLADENRVFYDDGDHFTSGDEDFALVTDFDFTQDTIQLQGSADFYSLDFFTSGAETVDAKLIHDPGISAVGETIAILENVDPNLSINDSTFTFV